MSARRTKAAHDARTLLRAVDRRCGRWGRSRVKFQLMFPGVWRCWICNKYHNGRSPHRPPIIY